MYRRMGLPELVARTADDYVAQALRLAGDPAERRACAEAIAARAGALFEDEALVRGFEGFFAMAVARAAEGGRDRGPDPRPAAAD
jgi:predicted O-linked N-acetylglucosamine transferase (SPINDLY family)